MRKSSRLFILGVVLTAGCTTFRPMSTWNPDVGEEIHVFYQAPTDVRLMLDSDTMTIRTVRLAGRVLSIKADTVLLAMSDAQRVIYPRDYGPKVRAVATVIRGTGVRLDTRQFAGERTVLAAGGVLLAGLAAFLIAFGQGMEGS